MDLRDDGSVNAASREPRGLRSDIAPRGRRRPLRVLAAILLPLLAAGLWTGLRAEEAKGHLERSRTFLESARAALLDRDVSRARASIARAGRETAQARELLGDPVTAAWAWLPYAGRSVVVGRGVADGADEIARDVLPRALKAAGGLDPKQLRRADGSIDVSVIRAAEPLFTKAAQRAAQVAARAAALPDSLLLSGVRGPRDEFVTEAAKLASALQGAADVSTVAPTLLGADRLRRYFVLVQQTSESRGTGGLPGGFAILEAREGKLRVTAEGSNADLVQQEVIPTGVPADFLERYGLYGFDIWQNVNLSPDLPVVAKVIEQRWRAQGGKPLDGVIALDAVALQDLLQGSGPVPLSGGRTLAPERVEDYLAIGQYRLSGNDQGVRKEQLVAVARAVIGRLTRGGGDGTGLVKGISTAVRSGHLRLTSDDPAVAAVLQRTGVDGGLPRGSAPFTYPVIFNSSSGKLDYFLDRAVVWRAGGCSGDRRRSTVAVTLTNRAPAASTLPPYVAVSYLNGEETHGNSSQVGLSVYATQGSRLVSATLAGKVLKIDNGGPHGALQPGVEAGLPVWLTFVDLPADTSVTLVLTLDEPTSPGAPRVYEQPLARPLRNTVAVPTCRQTRAR